jgi:hypothetical protein
MLKKQIIEHKSCFVFENQLAVVASVCDNIILYSHKAYHISRKHLRATLLSGFGC